MLALPAPAHRQAQELFEHANWLLSLKQYREALRLYADILRIAPYPTVWVHAGNTAREMGDEKSAMVFYREAEKLAPESPEVMSNIAISLRNAGHFEDAREYACRAADTWDEKSEAAGPDDEVPVTAAQLCLQTGQLARGWDYYRRRVIKVRHPESEFPPFWNGEPLPSTEKLLLWYEQGIGEEIMFASCLPDAQKMAPNLVVSARRKLIPALRRSFPEIEFISSSEFCGADVQAPIGSLPIFFRRTWESFPRRPWYLRADPARVSVVKEMHPAVKKRVGLSWRSPRSEIDEHKSIPIGEIARFVGNVDAEFYGLQYGANAEDRAALPGVYFPSVDPEVDFDGHLAWLSAMDLVVTNSGATAHAAGALGVPTLVVVPRARGLLFHWFVGRSDSPWYPSVTVVRCGEGGWAGAMDEAAGVARRLLS